MRPFRSFDAALPTPFRYVIAVVSVLLALGGYALLGEGAQQAPFSLFLAAVAIASWVGGLGAGLLATLLSALAIVSFFLPLQLIFDGSDPTAGERMAIFFVAALLIVALGYARSQAENAAHAQSARLQTTLLSIGDAVIATDDQGRVSFLNPVAQKLTGWNEADALGKDLPTIFNIVNQETREPVENPYSKVIRTGGVVGLANHTIVIGRDGTECPIDDSGAPIRNDNGDIIGVVLVFRDVTERVRADREREELLQREQQARADAEAAQQRFAFLAQASEVLSSSLDYRTTIASVARLAVPEMADWCAVDLASDSGTLERLAVEHVDPAKVQWAHELQRRYPPDPNAPTGAYHVMRTGQPEFYPEISEEMLQAAGVDEEQLQIIRDIGFTSAIVAPMATPERTLGVLSLVTTAESGKRFDESDVALARELARRAALAVVNARLYDEAGSAIRARDQFISVASHELKTPLSSLLGYTQLVQRRTEREGGLSERDQKALSMVVRQVRRLDRMINSLLDLSRIETGQLNIERGPVDVCALAQRLVEEIRPTLDQHTLEFSCPVEKMIIEGDEFRLEQVLHNLIQNAAKYSPEGGSIEVEVEHKADERQVCIAVSDHGIGIPDEAIPSLFTRFFRAHNARQISGMGIGLYVVREIITLHGGTTSVASKEGEGSTFTLCLPLADAVEG
jgi:PAS domain S-box-containing protein